MQAMERTRTGTEPEGAVAIVTETGTRYLDEDGDGLLDAVEVTERTVAVGRRVRRVLEGRRIRMAGIGDDGVPHRVTMAAWS